jgi:hypothetical protein
MTRDDWLFWGLVAAFAADVLVNRWHIRMLKARVRELETGEAVI